MWLRQANTSLYELFELKLALNQHFVFDLYSIVSQHNMNRESHYRPLLRTGRLLVVSSMYRWWGIWKWYFLRRWRRIWLIWPPNV